MGLLSGLLVGCSSPSTQNQRVYDRYAALVAERNRSQQAPAKPAVQKKKSSKKKSSTVKKSSTPKEIPDLKKTSVSPNIPAVTEPTPAPPVQVITPEPVKLPEPVKATPPTVKPVEVPAPVAPAPIKAFPTPTPELPADSIAGYTLKVGDGIQIFLRGIPAPEIIEDIIDERGMITMPLINDVDAAGLTASQLERRIKKMYLDKDIYRNMSVNVVVPTRYFFVQGEIRAPGRFQILSATRVSQAIAGAGGYTEWASGKVLIKRNGKIFKTIRNARRLERTPDDDILLHPDDIVEVKRSMW